MDYWVLDFGNLASGKLRLVLLPVPPLLTLRLLGAPLGLCGALLLSPAGGTSERKRRQQSRILAPHPPKGPKKTRRTDGAPSPKKLMKYFFRLPWGREEPEDRACCTARASHHVKTRLRVDSPPHPATALTPASRDRWRRPRPFHPASFSTDCSEKSGPGLAHLLHLFGSLPPAALVQPGRRKQKTRTPKGRMKSKKS